jgi:branched-chain amino acid transport system ATP-binding protein
VADNTILKIDNVTKRFGGLYALRKVSFEVEKGQIIGLIGPNGSGKTTLFNCISGMYPADGGAIYFEGANLVGLKPHQIARKGIGRTYQIARPFGDMTVRENVYVGAAFGCMAKEKSGRQFDVCYDSMKITNLESKADEPAESLTFGEKRRLEIARALALRPKLLLLDETMAGLTPTEVDSTLDMIRRIARELSLTVIVIEHVMHAIMTISEKVVTLNEGEKIAEGTPKEVAENPKVLTAYLGEEVPI